MALTVAKDIVVARALISAAKSIGKVIGLVPTMGSLHEGHLSLIDLAKKHADFVVVSIFVNPTQFGPDEDFAQYPREFERDRLILESRQVDMIFAPEANEIYPGESHISFKINQLADHLCGAKRPGHFEGVLQVVSKLFNITWPDIAVFGQKDLQQLLLIKRLVREFDIPVEIVSAPVIRESTGLALSSRNAKLSSEFRDKSSVLFRALSVVQKLIEEGERDARFLIDECLKIINSVDGAQLEYFEIVNLDTLQPMANLSGRIALAIAVSFGETRLIDNVVLEIEGESVRELRAIN
jgi:pantoate--beta-alanine ligase